MEEQSTLPLLQKEYHLDCPGCDYDRKRDLQEGLPYKEFLYIWMICLTAGMYEFCPSNLCLYLDIIGKILFFSFLLFKSGKGFTRHI